MFNIPQTKIGVDAEATFGNSLRWAQRHTLDKM